MLLAGWMLYTGIGAALWLLCHWGLRVRLPRDLLLGLQLILGWPLVLGYVYGYWQEERRRGAAD